MLDPADRTAFEKIHSQLTSEVTAYLEHPHSKHPESYKTTILIHQGLVNTFLARIKTIPMTGRELWRCMVELQQFMLEFRTALDYGTIYLPRIQGLESAASSVAATLGTFTRDPNVAKQCVIAGLPVWIVQDIWSIPHSRIDSVVEFERADGHIVLEESARKHPTIFKGKATNPQRLENIYLCSRIVLHTADIFASNYDPPPARSDVPRSLGSARANVDSHLGVHVSYHPCMSSHSFILFFCF